jgi:hypothetical protein
LVNEWVIGGETSSESSESEEDKNKKIAGIAIMDDEEPPLPPPPMVGDKRKGKAVAEPKKKKTRQEKEWDHVLLVLDTQGQSRRGIRIGESAQSQGEHSQGEQQQQTQQQQQLRRSGRGQPTEQKESPPSLARSGPRTRGGHTHVANMASYAICSEFDFGDS